MADSTLSLSGREGALIAALTRVIPTAPGEYGPGDDCARLDGGWDRVVTTDTMVEGTHFLRPHPPQWLGYKTLATNLSDVAAMGAIPEGFTLSVAVPRDLPNPWWELFAAGLAECAQESAVHLVGGDIVASSGPLMATVTCWGRLESGRSLRRDRGQPGDQLWVVGHIGRSAAGLAQWLEMHTRATEGSRWATESPRESWRTDPLLLAHLRPTPPLSAGPSALALGVLSAMDLSDGLWLDTARLAKASGLDAVIDLGSLPPDDALADVTPLSRVAGGEDYGLLLAAPPSLADSLASLQAYPIGTLSVSASRESTLWVKRSGQLVEIGAALADAQREAPFRHFTT